MVSGIVFSFLFLLVFFLRVEKRGSGDVSAMPANTVGEESPIIPRLSYHCIGGQQRSLAG